MMVPIRYNTWRDVPEQLKDKLWDSIEIAFTLDKKSRRNCMLTLGKCFRSFKNTLTVKHILPFKDEPEKALIGVYFGRGQCKKKNGSYDDVVIPVVEKIDELMKESQESSISYSGSNDILSQALATQERQVKFEADVLARLSQIGVATPQSDVNSSNMKSKLLLLQEVVEKPIRKVEEETLPVKIEPHMKMCLWNLNKHLQKKLSDARLTERFAFINPTLVSKARMGKTTKENKSRLIANRLMHAKCVDYIFIPYNPSNFHWVLVALDIRTMTVYYLDPMQKQPCDDLKEIVNMVLRIHPPEKQRSSKRDSTWVKVVCPRQLGSVECGYYVMRYMKDIIVDPSLLSTKMPSFQSSKSCRSHFDDSHMFPSHDK
ncbi:hypothetical protein CK203_102561 [Vitis vinifera]|uniref:Ubiquitin-like protease family profile domain-containing protein n=1 Tax=Vitis vinifera TaxID=29760 RepID=A0A438D113_VITVI|nr:hypothetical protein CK203_102561 [Vitis vinifera]